MKRLLRSMLAVTTLPMACGCGAGSSRLDPQQPLPAGRPDAPARIVICPEGSSYDPERNVCVAAGAAQAAPTTRATSDGDEAAGRVGVSVRCTFANGWVSVLPVADYPEDDSFLMQALIGMNEDPDFWANESDYASLRPYAARRCTRQGQTFRVAPGAHYVLAGETGTYARRGAYGRNGYKRRIQVGQTSPQPIEIETSDLTHTWDCISCPFVSFLDPWTGRWRPAFVILEHRAGAARRGTNRYRFEGVPVRDGKIRIRVAEAEREVSRIDQLVLVVGGQELLPSRGGAASPLAAIDGIELEMSLGTRVEVEYEVPAVRDGAVVVEVVAHGHYEPSSP